MTEHKVELKVPKTSYSPACTVVFLSYKNNCIFVNCPRGVSISVIAQKDVEKGRRKQQTNYEDGSAAAAPATPLPLVESATTTTTTADSASQKFDTQSGGGTLCWVWVD